MKRLFPVTGCLAGSSVLLLVSTACSREVVIKPPSGGNVNITITATNPAFSPDINQSPQVDLVFVLDTTGSMNGLINGAKEKIWSIVNTVSQARPAPKIRVGIIGYRDCGDQYVTDFNPLTDNIDSIYTRLMAYQAQGGGDRPESVNQALHEAVDKMNWSQNRGTCRTIFLVGDSPPHMDYQQDVKYQESCRLARQKDITISTILCGNYADTRGVWQDIAQNANGSFFEVAQNGSAVIVTTPYDGELKKLMIQLDGCRIIYGDSEVRRKEELNDKNSAKIAACASDSVSAQRAKYIASESKAKAPCSDLLVKLDRKEISAGKLEPAKLPAKLQVMSSGERDKYIQDMSSKRTQVSKAINELSEKRQQYIKENVAKDKLEKSFEKNIFVSMKKQMENKGFKLKESDLGY